MVISSSHRVQALIDLDAVKGNLLALRKLVNPEVAVWPAVKADAYGHGWQHVVPALDSAGADGFSVATTAEGALIRNSTQKPVLLMGSFLPEDVDLIRHSRLEAAVVSLYHAEILAKAFEQAGEKARVHLKIDTGMGRVGVSPETAVEMAKQVDKLESIHLTSLMTHFATSDESDTQFTMHQLEIFQRCAKEIQIALGRKLNLHCANSGAILGHPGTHLDMIRPGISIYGSHPGPEAARCPALTPVMTLKARIGFVKDIPADTPVSYGRTWISRRPSRIATALIGYGDGLPRKLSNCGVALVNGQRAPIVGRVCMDQTMLDVTDVGEVRVGDWAVFWGSQDGNVLHPEEVAQTAGTIPYELTCQVTSRVKRLPIFTGA